MDLDTWLQEDLNSTNEEDTALHGETQNRRIQHTRNDVINMPSCTSNQVSSPKESAKSKIKIAQINLQHKKAANDLLMNTVEDTKTDIVLITEPYISKKTHTIPGISQEFEQYHKGYGSLSAIVIRKSISHFRITEFETNKLTAMKVSKNNNEKIILASIYCPRGEEPISEEVKALVETEMNQGVKGIMGLDANAHTVNLGYDKSDKRAQEWEEFIVENSLSMQNNRHSNTFENTRGFKSKIDWTLATDTIADNINDWQAREDIETLSDHKWIEFEVEEEVTTIQEKRRNYHRVDWSNYCKELKRILNKRERQGNTELETTDEGAKFLTEAIDKATEKLVPLSSKRKYRNKWWSEELQKLKTAYKKAKKGTNKGIKMRAKIEYEIAINKAKENAWKKFLESVEGQNDVYIKYKILCSRKKKADIPSIRVNGIYTKTFEDTATELNRVNFPDIQKPLSLAHQTIENEVEQYFRERAGDNDGEEITPEEIKVALDGMKANKAPGQDRIPTIVLKKTWKVLETNITLLFNKIFNEGSFPESWKTAKVIYLKKPGKEGKDPKDYRPIALLNVISKLYEKVIYNRLNWLSEQNQWIDKDQFGFQKHVSAEHANLKFTNEIFQAFKKRKEVATIFADISGAFPSVWHEGLLYKMLQKKVPRKYMEFMRAYLKNRVVVVERNEKPAVTKYLNRSVPQGSSVGPWAWAIMFDDILRELKTAGYKAQAFADDLAVYRVKQKVEKADEVMDKALRIMEKWGDKWLIKFSQEKTKTMTFSRLRNTRRDVVKLGGVELENVEQYRYLGLNYDCKLNWKRHIKHQVADAIKTFTKLSGASSLKWGLKEIVKRYVYKNVVLPKLTYGAITWLSVIEQKCVKKLLTRVQRIAGIAITGTYRTSATNAVGVLAGIQPIHLEIKEKAALQLYDIYKNEELVRRLNILEVQQKLEATRTNTSSVQIAKKTLEEIQINHNTVEKIELESNHPAKLEIPPIELEDTNNQNDEGGVQDEINKSIYTDASKIEGSRVGLAVVQWIYGKWVHVIKKSIPEERSVFRGELGAIKEATEYIKENPEQSSNIKCIKSDSKSALQEISKPKSTDKDAKDIRKNIAEIKLATGKRIKLKWVKAHVGEEGNEEADKAAKEAIWDGDKIETEIIPRNVAKIRLKAKSLAEWGESWRHETTGRITHEIFHTVEHKGKYSHVIPEYHRKLLNRAASGHFPVNAYLRKIGKSEQDKCNYCTQRETIEHMIVHCPRFEAIRVSEIGINREDNLRFYLTKAHETTIKILKLRLEDSE